ncbi:MAG TPA: group I intron-associated PD-(D/E)XK endonuclease [Spirochaetota bacterium]|nr:group I intron-associated PD-(D/E)XK endonuclease [Spirochaetota bacterium]
MARKNQDRKVKAPVKTSIETATEGGLRELKAAAILMQEGFSVFTPVINMNYRYDLIAEKNNKFYRIQVKSLSLQFEKNPEYSTSCDQYIIHAYTTPRGKKRTYSKEDCDFIIGIDLNNDQYACIPIKHVPASGNIRVSAKTKTAAYLNNICI